MDGAGRPDTDVDPAADMLMLAQLGAGWDNDFRMLLVALALYGVYFTMMAMALWLTFKRPEKAQVTKDFLPPMLIAFICVTIDLPVQATFIFRQLRTMVVQNYTSPVEDRLRMFVEADWFRPLFITGAVVQGIAGETGIVLVIDNMLRVRRRLGVAASFEKYIPWVLYIGVAVAFFTAVPAKIRLGELSLGRRDVYNSNPFAIAMNVGQALIIPLALSTATLYWSAVRKGIRIRKAAQPGWKVPFVRFLIAIYESGLWYAALQATRLSIDLSANPGTPRDSSLYLANAIWGEGGLILAVMHAPAIVLIRASKRSMAYTLVPKDTIDDSGRRSSLDSDEMGNGISIQFPHGGEEQYTEGRESKQGRKSSLAVGNNGPRSIELTLPQDPEKALKREEIYVKIRLR